MIIFVIMSAFAFKQSPSISFLPFPQYDRISRRVLDIILVLFPSAEFQRLFILTICFGLLTEE